MKRTLAILTASPLSMLGAVLVTAVILAALFADIIAPFPEHRGAVVDFANFNKAPEWPYLMGTDLVGRDMLSRILYAYRLSLILAIVVLVIAVPIGVTLGLIAGYAGGWTDYVLMRITDVFLSIPPLVLAMAIMGVLEPTLLNGMLAVTAMWWPLVHKAGLQHHPRRTRGGLCARRRGDWSHKAGTSSFARSCRTASRPSSPR